MESLQDSIESFRPVIGTESKQFTRGGNPQEFLTDFVPDFTVFTTTFRDTGLNDIDEVNFLLQEENGSAIENSISNYNISEESGFYDVNSLQLTDEELQAILSSFSDLQEPQEKPNYHYTEIEEPLLSIDLPTVTEVASAPLPDSSIGGLSCGRFLVNIVPNIPITLEESLVQCLGVVINYHGYEGIILNIENEASRFLVNHACTLHDCRRVSNLALSLFPHKNDEIPEISGSLQRIRYKRDIREIYNSVTNIVYYESCVFSSTNPYEPQYYRYEIDDNGKRINESKCGACPYCRELKFLTFKNSSYLSHLTLEHGIYSNNYLIPEGLYYGVYEIKKLEQERTNSSTGDSSKTRFRQTKAVQCPVCFTVVEVCCWSMKTNPLLSFYRHFKKRHSNIPNNQASGPGQFNSNTHVQIQKRGRTLQVKDK